MDQEISTETLYYQIDKTNEQYHKFILKQLSQAHFPTTNMQPQTRFATLRNAQKNLVNMAKYLIQDRLEFIEQLANVLKKTKQMEEKLQQKISQNKQFAKICQVTVSFVESAEMILEIGKKLYQQNKFLLQRWDVDFIKDLKQRGISIDTIRIFIHNNIRREHIQRIDDQMFLKLGINNIGDEITLGLMRKGN